MCYNILAIIQRQIKYWHYNTTAYLKYIEP